MAKPRIGMNAKLYYKAGGQSGGGAWTLINNARDVTLPLTKNEADATTRGNNGWDAILMTTKMGEIQFEMVWDDDDPVFNFFAQRYLDGAAVGIQCLSALQADGGQGLQADMQVANFERGEPLKDMVTASVTLKITYSSTPPSWIGGS